MTIGLIDLCLVFLMLHLRIAVALVSSIIFGFVRFIIIQDLSMSTSALFSPPLYNCDVPVYDIYVKKDTPKLAYIPPEDDGRAIVLSVSIATVVRQSTS